MTTVLIHPFLVAGCRPTAWGLADIRANAPAGHLKNRLAARRLIALKKVGGRFIERM